MNAAREWYLLRVDETEYMNDVWRRSLKVEHYWCYYLFDRTRGVHLCELTPSFELWYAGFDVECSEDATDEEREHAWEDLLGAQQELVTYMHTFDVDKAVQEGRAMAVGRVAEVDVSDIPDSYDVHGDESEREYRYIVDQILEYYSGNSPGW